jgi:hypothetical protein
MRRLACLVLILSALLAVPLAAETVSQCIVNCPPGNNSCTQCCLDQFEAAAQPCYSACTATLARCSAKAAADCNAKHLAAEDEVACYAAARNVCWVAYMGCHQGCNPQVQGGCPGEVPPQKCPYTCQSWNPASQSCVGAALNRC